MLLPLELIKTTNKVISVKGKVLYNDRKRKIDLKRPIRDLFDSVSVDVFYTMELCLSKQKVLERVSELSDNNVIPVILYFMNGGKNG
jgi:hypothetical protein